MYKRIYDSDEIVVDLDGQKLRVSVFDGGHWVDEHFVELPEMEPVVHAHWGLRDLCGDGCSLIPYCSNCGEHDGVGYERCPHCGAHMDEEVAE